MFLRTSKVKGHELATYEYLLLKCKSIIIPKRVFFFFFFFFFFYLKPNLVKCYTVFLLKG